MEALAVIPLVIQLVTTTKSISDFLRTIREAPSELSDLIETTDQLQASLRQVQSLIEQQFSNERLASSPVFLLHPLELCGRRVQPTESFVKELRAILVSGTLIKSVTANLDIRAKKKRINRLESQLRDAVRSLQFAITCNQWQLQLQ